MPLILIKYALTLPSAIGKRCLVIFSMWISGKTNACFLSKIMACHCRMQSSIETSFSSVCGLTTQGSSIAVPAIVVSLILAECVGRTGPLAVRMGSGLLSGVALDGTKLIMDGQAHESKLNLLSGFLASRDSEYLPFPRLARPVLRCG